jgi:malate dehydrogenase (oxaloacetate-decarboxylating)(NADP+)
MSEEQIKKAALDYHRTYPPGKLEIVATKPMSNRFDLSLAYSPGVAAACEEIQRDVGESFNLTTRGNAVAVISNGTAVLGLGNIGPHASKPVMEGKAVLFKKFANIDGIDLEVDCTDVDKFCDLVAALEPSFGGINLEDIKAPECFEIEQRLVERMNIPVFHDDQHGTAIIATAGLLNALELNGKDIAKIKVVCNGAGAAGLSILNMFIAVGISKDNILLCDSKGVVHSDREDLNSYKKLYVQKTDKRSLKEALDGADVFVGVSVAGALSGDMLVAMNKDPVVFALANPMPEILPEVAQKIRPDVIIATGRSDYPNQINNVLCFPFLFRGALDVRATTINMEMKLAAAKAIAQLAKRELDESARNAYSGEELLFSREMIIPKPFDLRLIEVVSTAVAEAAMNSGVATKPIDSLYSYRQKLRSFVERSASIVQRLLVEPVEDKELKRVIFSDGEDMRVLNAAQMLINDGVAKPVLIARRRVIELYIKRYGLNFSLNNDVEVVDPEDDSRYREYHKQYHEIAGRSGVSPEYAKVLLRTNTTIIASMLLKMGEGDAMICGLTGDFANDLKNVTEIIGLEKGVSAPVAVNTVLLAGKPLFIADTRVSQSPNEDRIVEIAHLASQVVREFSIEPKIALVSHSSYGSSDLDSAKKMRRATEILKARYPQLDVEGEITPEAALDGKKRSLLLPSNTMQGSANLLVMPDLDAANIAYRLVRASYRDGFTIGPIFVGLEQPVSIISKVANARSVYNMTAVTINQHRSKQKDRSK